MEFVELTCSGNCVRQTGTRDELTCSGHCVRQTGTREREIERERERESERNKINDLVVINTFRGGSCGVSPV